MAFRPIHDYFAAQWNQFSTSSRVWNPPTDIFEADELTVIRMEVAGLDEGQLQITAHHNLLTVRGQRLQDHPPGDIHYHQMEVHYGPFERVFRFSYAIGQDDIKAVYQKGFLSIQVRRHNAPATKVSVEIVQEHS